MFKQFTVINTFNRRNRINLIKRSSYFSGFEGNFEIRYTNIYFFYGKLNNKNIYWLSLIKIVFHIPIENSQ